MQTGLTSTLSEPGSTAALFAVVGGLLAASALLSRFTQRISVPLVLLFLCIGMLAGSEGVGRIAFADYGFAFRAGTAALVLILFDGGLNTSIRAARKVALPSAVLATIGVLGTAGLVAIAARWLGLDWPSAMLLGAVVSSTDAAAVFGVLRGSNIRLDDRIGTTLEIESGINDPMAVLLTTLLTANLVAAEPISKSELISRIVTDIVVGGAFGYAIGSVARWMLMRVRLPASGLYPVFTLSVAFLSFAVPTLVHGSGFLGVYVAGVVVGSGRLPYRANLLSVHDGLAWLAQVAMFLMLGLLVFPTRLVDVALLGLGLALWLAIVARPVITAICLAPFGFSRREVAYVGWVGLRGAVPIILATFPVISRAPGAERIFDLVFFIVVVNAVVPGMTVKWLTKKLMLESEEPPPAQAVLHIESATPLDGELLSFYIDEALDVAGVTLAELEFPEGAAITMIVRERQLIAPKGTTELRIGDHVYVVTKPEGRAFVQLMFGRPEE